MTITVVDELTRLADCPTCGRPRWVSALCGCGHRVVFHQLGVSKGEPVRTECLTGGCDCRLYSEAVQ